MARPGSSEPPNVLRSTRVLIIGLVAVIVVLGFVLIMLTIGRSGVPPTAEPSRINVLVASDSACVVCHRRATPGIVERYGHSSMAAAGVSCQDCHAAKATYPGAVAHQGTHVLRVPTTAICAKCHAAETAQFNQSRHALPAYVAMVGREGLPVPLQALYDAIPEARMKPNEMRNALFAIEGPAVTRFACESCHNVGKPAPDDSIGQCQKCHLRHEFSLEQARKPETCNARHIGPDHPQWEIYQESPHGIAYATGGHRWHWEAEPGTLTVRDFPAPTCATCHISGFGASGTTHDVGDRLTWYLFAPISERRPSWEDSKARMQNVCRQCHSNDFIITFYQDADRLTVAINDWVRESDDVIAPLRSAGQLTAQPFDEPIDFVHFDLWHHWGRTAKFGAWMQGPDYVQRHGAYETLKELAELREMVQEKLHRGQAVEGGR